MKLWFRCLSLLTFTVLLLLLTFLLNRSLSRSIKSNQSNLIIYNRVPKCASTQTRILLTKLRQLHPERYHAYLESAPHIKQFLNDTQKTFLLNRSLSRSIKSNQSNLIIYNRVPKCASTQTRILLTELRQLYPERYHAYLESAPHIKQFLNDTEKKDLVGRWSSIKSPTLFIRHVYFIDFKEYGYPQPSYINVIRDPVESFISGYYFMRFGFQGWTEQKIKKWLGSKSEKERYTSVEKCITLNAKRCVETNPTRLLAFFCGHQNECRSETQWALDEAKRNVAKYFAVVGLVEDYETTLKLLEMTFPRYFQNLSQTYEKLMTKKRFPLTRTAKKVNPPEHIKLKIREVLHFQVEFYEFVKERFYEQLDRMQLKTTIDISGSW